MASHHHRHPQNILTTKMNMKLKKSWTVVSIVTNSNIWLSGRVMIKATIAGNQPLTSLTLLNLQMLFTMTIHQPLDAYLPPSSLPCPGDPACHPWSLLPALGNTVLYSTVGTPALRRGVMLETPTG
jgi:hypothetical protein